MSTCSPAVCRAGSPCPCPGLVAWASLPSPKAPPVAPERASSRSMYRGTMTGLASSGRISRCRVRCGGIWDVCCASERAAVVVVVMVLLVGAACARSGPQQVGQLVVGHGQGGADGHVHVQVLVGAQAPAAPGARLDRKSTRLNSSHVAISYAVF